jgi:hypothetical protein
MHALYKAFLALALSSMAEAQLHHLQPPSQMDVGCNLQTLNMRISNANAACCGLDGMDLVLQHGGCSGSTNCSLACATILVPLFLDCRTLLNSIYDGADAGVPDGISTLWNNAYQSCLRIPPQTVLAAVARQIDDGLCSLDDANGWGQTSVITSCADNNPSCSVVISAGIPCSNLLGQCDLSCSFCGGTSGGGHRRLTARRQLQGANTCNTATLNSQFARINTVCCDGTTCSGGVPTSCDAKCAVFFVDFYDRCHSFLGVIASPSTMIQLGSLHDVCAHNLPTEQLLRLAAVCQNSTNANCLIKASYGSTHSHGRFWANSVSTGINFQSRNSPTASWVDFTSVHQGTSSSRYFLLNSGPTCSAMGYASINTQSECEAAATALGFPDTSASGGHLGTQPEGCVWSSNHLLSWSPPSSTSARACGTHGTGSASSYIFDCVCAVTATHGGIDWESYGEYVPGANPATAQFSALIDGVRVGPWSEPVALLEPANLNDAICLVVDSSSSALAPPPLTAGSPCAGGWVYDGVCLMASTGVTASGPTSGNSVSGSPLIAAASATIPSPPSSCSPYVPSKSWSGTDWRNIMTHFGTDYGTPDTDSDSGRCSGPADHSPPFITAWEDGSTPDTLLASDTFSYTTGSGCGFTDDASWTIVWACAGGSSGSSGSAISWTTLPSHYCVHYHGSYSSVSAARSACIADSDCVAVYDDSCDDSGPHYLCDAGHPNSVSSAGSCLYIKESNNPSSVLPGAVGGTCDLRALDATVKRVNSMCCMGSSDTPPPGFTCAAAGTCSVDCAMVALPLLRDCRALLDHIYDNADSNLDGRADVFTLLHRQCSAIPVGTALQRVMDLHTAGHCSGAILNGIGETAVTCADSNPSCSTVLGVGIPCSNLVGQCDRSCGYCSTSGRRLASSTPAKQTSRRRVQTCDMATFQTQVSQINANCCDGGCAAGTSGPGIPTTCDAKCAVFFVPFYTNCSGIVSATFGPTTSAALSQLSTTCTQAIPAEDLLLIAAQCSSLPSAPPPAPPPPTAGSPCAGGWVYDGVCLMASTDVTMARTAAASATIPSPPSSCSPYVPSKSWSGTDWRNIMTHFGTDYGTPDTDSDSGRCSGPADHSPPFITAWEDGSAPDTLLASDTFSYTTGSGCGFTDDASWTIVWACAGGSSGSSSGSSSNAWYESASAGDTCTATCGQHHMTCMDGAWPVASNSLMSAVVSAVGATCAGGVQAGSANYNPSIRVSDNECYWQNDPAGNPYLCSTSDSAYKRFCWCESSGGTTPPPPPPPPPSGALPNDCSPAAIPLSSAQGSHSDTTTGHSTGYSSPAGSGPQIVFVVTLSPNAHIDIGQTTNSFDSEVTANYGSTCPGSNQIIAFDDPDTQRVSWTNSLNTAQLFYFVIDGYSSGSYGSFTISWTITGNTAGYAGSGSTGTSWTTLPSHFCDTYHGSYSSVSAARSACITDSNCVAVYDDSCDDSGPHYLCDAGHSYSVSTAGSCLYIKS